MRLAWDGSTRTTLPTTPPGGLTAGLGWGKLDKPGCREVAVERPDRAAVAARRDATLTVLVVNPNKVESL